MAMKKQTLALAVAMLATLTSLSVTGIRLRSQNLEVGRAWREVGSGYQERAALLPPYLHCLQLHLPTNAEILRVLEREALSASQGLSADPPAAVQSFQQLIDPQAGLTIALA